MKCAHCNNEINESKEKFELFGCDGDFIHNNCRPLAEIEMNRLANMTSKEFANWIMGKE